MSYWRHKGTSAAPPTPLKAIGITSKQTFPTTPSTTTGTPTPGILSLVNAQTFFQQHPITPPTLPHDLEDGKPWFTQRNLNRRQVTEASIPSVERPPSEEKRRVSEFRGPVRCSPTKKESPLLVQTTSPVVKHLTPANESFVLPTTRTTTGARTARTGSGSPRTSPSMKSIKPHPEYQDRLARLRSRPDKFRDQVVAELFNEVRCVPVVGLTSRRRSFDPNRDAAMTAATVTSILRGINSELDGPLKDVSSALKDSDAAIERSVDIARLARNRQTESAPQLIAMIAKVSRKKMKLTAKGAQGQGPTNAVCVDPGVTALTAEALSAPYVTMMTPDFAADGLSLLSNGLACQTTRAATRQTCLEFHVPATAEAIVKDPKAYPPAKQAATEFGVHFSENPTDRSYLAKHHPTLLGEEQTISLPVLMRVVKRKVGVGKVGDGSSSQLLANSSPTRFQLRRDTAESSDDLGDIVRRVDNPTSLNDPEAAVAFAELAATFAAKRRTKKVIEAGGHELLLKLLKIHAGEPLVVGPILDAFSYLCEDDPFLQYYTADNVPPVVQAHAIADDPDCVYKYVDLLEDLVVFGSDEAREKIAKAKVLADLDLLEERSDPEEVPLLISISDIRKCLVPEDNPLTLKEVYSILMSRQYNDESLNIVEERSVKRLFNFVRKKVREYGATDPITDGVFGFTASELMYGCMCFQLLASVEDNHGLFKQFEVPHLMLEIMRIQLDEQIAQHAVLTAMELAKHQSLVELFVDTEEKKQLIVQMLKRGRKATELDLYNAVEDLVGPRVQLIERTAVKRETYSGTDAVSQLVDTWDDYEYYFFGNIRVKNEQDLKAIFKADRKGKRKANMARRLHRAPPEQRRDSHMRSQDGGSESGKKRSLVRRASQFLWRKDTDENKSTRAGSVVSPLERRKSIVGGQAVSAPVTPSPLERRRSVVGGGRRLSTGSVAAAPLNAESQAPGLMRRASQLFGAPVKAEPVQQGVTGLGGTIAQARAAATQGQPSPLQRRASFFSRNPAPSPTVMQPATSPDKRRASLLQRRASMTSPVAEPHPLRRGVTRKSSNGSSVYDTHTLNGSVKSGKSLGSESRWSDFDFEGVDENECFIPRMIEYVFKALRRAVGAPEIGTLKKANVPMRLVGLIADHETPPAAFPDILYLIGMLAGTDRALKEEFGEYQAVEKACSLLKRAYQQQGAYVSEVVTNACLCLATLCVVHLPNTKRFEKKKGPQLTVNALIARGDYNDTQAVNAASALICNLCYKNESMKGILGDVGASEALVRAMAKYESTGTQAEGTRCISSLFKAIGNLSLNQGNMEKLMASDVEVAYCSFLGQVDGELDDSTLEAALRTLSNLVIEKDNMERFAPVVVPFLSMLRRERTVSTDVHRWAFMTLAGLCRRPKNAQTFCENDGVRTVMKLIPYLDRTPSLRAALICLLGIQTTHPPNVTVLVDNGVFYVIAETLREFLSMLDNKPEVTDLVSQHAAFGGMEQQANDILAFSQLPISSLRCAHRCLTDRSAAQECVKEEVFDLAQRVLIRSAFQPMLTYETLRVIFGCLSLLDPGNFSRRSSYPFLNYPIIGTKEKDKASEIYHNLLHQWGVKELEALRDGEDPLPDEAPYKDPTEPEWLLTLGDHVRRPADPRIWAELKMTPNMIQICETIRRIVSGAKAMRNVRLQRCALGALAWMSCERVCAPSLMRRLHLPIDPELHCPLEEESDDDIDPAPPQPLQRRKSVWDAFKRDKTQTAMNVDDVQSSARAPLQRRKSVWDAFKRDKNELKLDRKSEFGRQRKADDTSVVDIVKRTLQNLWFDQDCVDLALLLLNNCIWITFGQHQLTTLLADVELYKLLKAFVDRNEERAKAYWLFTLKNYKRFLQTQGKFFPIEDESDCSEDSQVSRTPANREGTSVKVSRSQPEFPKVSKRQYLNADDLGLMYALALSSFPVDLTQWDIDPFPDGVQSLPPETRKKLRLGGKCEYIDNAGKRNHFYHKSSHDLVLFEWKIVPLDAKTKEVDPQYPHALAISRFHLMSAGVDHPNFIRGMQFDRGLTESKCCVLKGPAIASLPEGTTLCLKFKDSHTRDSFLHVMGNWREACAFGFI